MKFLSTLTARLSKPKPVVATPSVTLHPELQQVLTILRKRLVGVFAVLAVVIILLLGVLALVWQVQHNSAQTRAQVASVLAAQTTTLQQLSQTVTLQEQGMNSALQQLTTQTAAGTQSLKQQLTVNVEQQAAITQTVNQLQQELQSLSKTLATPAHTTTVVAQDPAQKIAAGYHLYGVEPYGVVIQNPQGQFEIARIGKILPIGEITAISSTAVQAGAWTIIGSAS